MDRQATIHANKTMRRKAKKNPCYLCEQIDCESCEYFDIESPKKQEEVK